MTKTVGGVTTSRTAMSRESAPAASDPKPTVTTGTCWTRSRWAATSGASPAFYAPSEKTTSAATFVPAWRLTASISAVPSAVSRPSGGASSSGRVLARAGVEPIGPDLQVRRRRPDGGLPLSRAFSATSQRLLLDLVGDLHARRGVDQEDERGRLLAFSWMTTDGRSAATRQSRTAASRRPSATQRQPPEVPRIRRW